MIRSVAHRVRALARATIGPSALILTYHRVADLERDPQLLAVTIANFEAQAAILASRYQVVPLVDLVDDLRSRRLHDRTVAFTFDDGYADNLENARSTLETHGLPATVFVSSGCLGGDREFWWDEIERIVLADDPDTTWNVLEPPRTAPQREYLELMAAIHPLPARERDAALVATRNRYGAAAGVRQTNRPLTAADIAALDASLVIEVGAHSADHEVLSGLSELRQRETILQDKAELERLCSREMRLFSYPYGQRDDYSAATVEIVRDAGFQGACANHPGLVKPRTDPFRLPRHVVRNWSADELAARIDAWFAGREVGP